MKRTLLFAVPLLLFMALAVVFFSRLGEDPNRLPTALAGKPLPAFSLPTLDGGTLTQDDLRGPLLLNVWGTWCPACYEEHPYLLELAKQGVVIVGMNYKDDPAAARGFLQRLGSPYREVIVDADGRLGLDLGVYGAPETFVIDAGGIIRHRITGVVTPQNFAAEIAPLLGIGPAAGVQP
ncbi:MAG: DsbE family thiol:disulfide interchange protein [Gammaproteobacteria bacterium]